LQILIDCGDFTEKQIMEKLILIERESSSGNIACMGKMAASVILNIIINGYEKTPHH